MQSKHLCIIEAVASVLFADLENGEPDLLLRRTSLSLYTCNRVRIFFFPMQSLSFLFQRYLRMLVLCFPPPGFFLFTCLLNAPLLQFVDYEPLECVDVEPYSSLSHFSTSIFDKISLGQPSIILGTFLDSGKGFSCAI